MLESRVPQRLLLVGACVPARARETVKLREVPKAFVHQAQPERGKSGLGGEKKKLEASQSHPFLFSSSRLLCVAGVMT